MIFFGGTPSGSAKRNCDYIPIINIEMTKATGSSLKLREGS